MLNVGKRNFTKRKKKNLFYNFEIEKEIVKNNRLKFFRYRRRKVMAKKLYTLEIFPKARIRTIKRNRNKHI